MQQFDFSKKYKEYIGTPVICYGAGAYLPHWLNWLGQRGFSVKCCADIDTAKHDTLVYNYKIMSLQNALETFPDSMVFISTQQDKWKSIADRLDVSTDKILNFVTHRFVSHGCNNLGSSVSINARRLLAVCATGSDAKLRIPMDINNVEGVCDTFLSTIEEMYIQRVSGELVCKGCPNLHSLWLETLYQPYLSTIGFSGADICNIKCIYCNHSYSPPPRPSNTDLDTEIELLRKICAYFVKRNVMDAKSNVIIANGEISVYPKRDELLEIIKDFHFVINTNAVAFYDNLAETGGKKRTEICISNDCGTSETYKLIKGIDAYTKACNNILRYRDAGCEIILKYIFLPGKNDNQEDIERFTQFCSIVNPKRVMISRNVREQANGEHLPDISILMIKRLSAFLSEAGIQFGLTEAFTQKDLSAMRIEQ